MSTTDYPGRAEIEGRWAGRLVMVAPEAYKAYGLASAVSGLRVLTSATGAPVEALRRLGAEVRSAGSTAGPSTTHALVDSAEGRRALREWAAAPVVVFRPDFKGQTLLEELGCRAVGAEPRVARRLENKRAFRDLCAAVGLPVVDTVETAWPPTARRIGELTARWGEEWVIQTPRGYAGRRTWPWSTRRRDGLPNWLDGRPVLISPRVDGPTWTANAVVDSSARVRVGRPMRQVTGDPRLGDLPMASCGVAFEPAGAELIGEELEALARSVGELARAEGFVGFFGIDAVGAPGRLLLLEMNARLTATLTAATMAELEAGQLPLVVSHVLACLGEGGPGTGALDRPPAMSRGGHLVVRDAGHSLAALSGPATYRVDGGGLDLVSPSADWPQPDAVTVWPAGPAGGGPEDERYRLHFGGEMVDGEGAFTPFVESVIEGLLE